MSSRATLLVLAAFALASPAFAQSPSIPRGEPQSSNMSPPSGNNDAGNNGVGTAGSQTGNNGTASSTVNAGNSSLAAAPKHEPAPNRGTGGTLENDPAVGGGAQSGTPTGGAPTPK